MSAQTATVEALTAEVRVLMVGNRQVTLSVYRQLDWLRHDRIVPFGRVNDEGKRSREDVIYDRHWLCVVGRSASSGALARARIEWTQPFRNSKESDEDFMARVARFEEWITLPLIVLAGLR